MLPHAAALAVVGLVLAAVGAATRRAHPGAHQGPSPWQEACIALDALLPGATTRAASPRYATLSSQNWSGTARASPACIVQPSTAQQVQLVVRQLVARDVRFAVRSGGHSPSPGAANIDDGVLVDLSRLDELTYHADSATVTVGAGNTWARVYGGLDAFNVTVVGGRVLDVGVGGLLLGSGLSYLSDLYGFACDNVAEHQVVLADGSLVTASASENPDLHWALKGGANNFGIVTSFTLYTYPIHNVWGGARFYSIDQLPALYAAMAEYQAAPNKDLYANLMLQGSTTNATLGAFLTLVYLKPEADPAAFAPFASIPTVADTTKLRTLTDLMASQPIPEVPRFDWFATSFRPDAALYASIHNATSSPANLAPLKALTAGILAIGLQPISSNAVLAGRARGGNALGLSAVNQTWFVTDVGWYYPAGDGPGHEAAQAIRDDIWEAASASGLELPYIFMNDASYDQPVFPSYGAENVARLKAVQCAYDPERVFQKLVPGGFKLG